MVRNAIVEFSRLAESDPNNAHARINLGSLLFDVGEPAAALPHLEAGVRLRPRLPEAWHRLALTQTRLGLNQDALNSFDIALRLRTDWPAARYDRSFVRLSLGDFSGGFADYEARFVHPEFQRQNAHLPAMNWSGNPGGGGLLRIHAEQGLGDCIQFLRFVPAAAQHWRGPVELVLPECLTRLVRHSKLLDGLDATMVCSVNQSSPVAEARCALMSLPALLGLTKKGFPVWNGPYLNATPAALRAAGKYTLPASSPKVGLIWAGNPANPRDAQRSLPPSGLDALSALPCQWISLQKQVSATPMPLPCLPGLVPYGQHLDDFSDTAALMNSLDLLISVDTATAHLAGALGRPTILLLPSPADWRWGTHGTETPWYPTMKLIRQPSPGHWEAVISELQNELLRLLNTAFGAHSSF